MPFDHLPAADLDQLFADWGEPAQLEELTYFYDPGTGLMEESDSTIDVKVVASSRISNQGNGAVATNHDEHAVFLVRSADIPDGTDLSFTHLIVDGSRWSIEKFRTTPAGLIAIDAKADRTQQFSDESSSEATS